ncbi:MAG TPA: hypothetical protein VGO92_14190 [Acidimicrobiales bacterium]|jgi:hypothetical protein|nr:hypothetical protein [Acidimicrobiales bacterium]
MTALAPGVPRGVSLRQRVILVVVCVVVCLALALAVWTRLVPDALDRLPPPQRARVREAVKNAAVCRRPMMHYRDVEFEFGGSRVSWTCGLTPLHLLLAHGSAVCVDGRWDLSGFNDSSLGGPC